MKLLSHGPEPCASANSAIPALKKQARSLIYVSIIRNKHAFVNHFFNRIILDRIIYLS